MAFENRVSTLYITKPDGSVEKIGNVQQIPIAMDAEDLVMHLNPNQTLSGTMGGLEVVADAEYKEITEETTT